MFENPGAMSRFNPRSILSTFMAGTGLHSIPLYDFVTGYCVTERLRALQYFWVRQNQKAMVSLRNPRLSTHAGYAKWEHGRSNIYLRNIFFQSIIEFT